MLRKSNLGFAHKQLDFIFILALLCIFAFGSFIMVIYGANIYKGIHADMDSNFEFRTPLSYISTKVRQNDDQNMISIVEKDGVQALVLETIDSGERSQTWIYEYNHSLREIYLTKGISFQLDDGQAILPSYGLTFEMENGLLNITTKDHRGNSRSLSIAFRAEQGGGS